MLAQETLDRLIEGMSARDQEIVMMRLHGEDVGEIARKFDITGRTVRRVLNRIEPGADP